MANTPSGVILQWLTEPSMVDARTRHQLLNCWRDVSNAGGAVGFPFLPVDDAHVLPAVDALVDSLDAVLSRLLLATVDASLAGWLLLVGNASKVTAHWGRVLRVQTALAHRGTGIGRAMMAEVSRCARDDLGLEQLHLELRAGLGLESFYRACGWREVGRWPAALRLREDDDRDEVLMLLTLR
jgi:GNAT superfamily N-acetyltransferase